jgi:hypothetical protein
MKKIPTIFMRDMTKQPALVTPEWNPKCLWVRDGEGVATAKIDGTCCMVSGGKLFKRRECKDTDPVPDGFELCERDVITGKSFGWVPVGDGPEDKWHREAFTGQEDGTYELIGPKVQKNKYSLGSHELLRHGALQNSAVPREFEALREYLRNQEIEGYVWHHSDGRMAKIKRRDFGFRW